MLSAKNKLMDGVDRVIQKWVSCWEKGAARELGSLYTEECIFYSTIGEKLVTTSSGVADYFEGVFLQHPGVQVKAEPLHWIRSGEHFFTVGGRLLFLTVKDGSYRARVAWVFRCDNAEWLIHCHHSSIPIMNVADVKKN